MNRDEGNLLKRNTLNPLFFNITEKKIRLDVKFKIRFNSILYSFTLAREGKRHLGTVIGSNYFRTKYVNEKVTEWCNELKILSEFAKSQPQAAYAAFCFGEQNKFSYFLRTTPEMNDLMKQVDEIVQYFLLPAIIGEIISGKERELYSLPVRSGGLGIPLFSDMTCNELENSFTTTAPHRPFSSPYHRSRYNTTKCSRKKRTAKIITQRKTGQLSTSHQRLKQTWILIEKERSLK